MSSKHGRVSGKKSQGSKKRLKTCHSKSPCVLPVLNKHLANSEFSLELQKTYASNADSHAEDVTFSHKPFFHAVINNLIENPDFLQNLQEELSELTFVEKNNDLYKFHQSLEDLRSVDSPNINALRSLIYKDLKEWITMVTGIELNDTVDLSCAKYQYTDTLLCHDDELDDRRIAFIYYLVPESWNKDDGGALDLFSVDESGQPDNVVKSITPMRNNFAFFEVNPLSFHQVAEVLTEDKTRLSISGWFHGVPVDRPEPYIEPPIVLQPAKPIDEDTFFEWINPAYLDPVTQSEIQEKFEEDSEIELSEFLIPEKYKDLTDSVQQSGLCWKHKGPANKRSLFTLDISEAPDILKKCIDFLQSDAFFLVLSNLTGLKLHELAPGSDSEGETSDSTKTSDNTGGSNPCCCTEIRKWCHGGYTLVRDSDCSNASYELDSILHLCCEGWDPEYGGFTSYIAKGEDEELLSVYPTENSLSLVYRDKETLKFVKHINNRINQMPTKGFYDISSVYRE